MKISAKSGASVLLVLGVFFALFGFYFFYEYSPLSHSISDPKVILWYPIGLALMLGGVASVVAASFGIGMANLRREVDELDGKTGQLTGRITELTGKVGALTKTVDRLGGDSEKLAKKTDELTTRVDKLTSTTKAEFEKLSAIMKKKSEISKKRERS